LERGGSVDIIQVGLGEFGFSWLYDILKGFDGVRIVGLVYKKLDNARKEKLLEDFDASILFESLSDALSGCKPDFILNVTPPSAHKKVILEAFKHGIPVLSEKPIAEDYRDVIEIIKASAELQVPLMISENFRFFEVMRRTKQIIDSGEIGQLNSLNIDFFRNHRTTNYHKDLEHPLLLDVSIHHLDLIRYLTGVEAIEVFAKAWSPAWSWYKGYSCIDAFIEMEKDIKISYRGSLTSALSSTDWLANWRIEGHKGYIEVNNNEIRIFKGKNTETIRIFDQEDSRRKVLAEFIQSLNEKRLGETDISDNIKTFNIVQSMTESIKNNKAVKVSGCEDIL
jgi:predicted dehydrogenase